MKIKSNKASVDIVVILILLVIFGTVALIVVQGIGNSTKAASDTVNERIYDSYTYSSETGEYVPNEPSNPEEPEEIPENPEEEDGEEDISLTLTEKERLKNNESLKDDITKSLRNGNYNFRSYKLTRHQTYELSEYSNAFNGRNFDGKGEPTGVYRSIFKKYKVL